MGIRAPMALLLVAGALGCGGIAHRDAERAVDDAGSLDAREAGEGHATPACVRRSTFVVDSGLADGGCRFDPDCSGGATCQSGLCCSGEVVAGRCLCGAGPGCDRLHVCCVARGATEPACLDRPDRCGAW